MTNNSGSSDNQLVTWQMLQGDQSGAANHKAGAAAGAGGGGFEIEDFDDLSDHEGMSLSLIFILKVQC